MAEYQLISGSDAVLRRADSATIPNDPANFDRHEYNLWLAAGNTPDPAPPPPPPIAQSADALELSQAKQLAAQGRTDEALAAILKILGA